MFMAAECSVLLAVPGRGAACGARAGALWTTSAAMQASTVGERKQRDHATPARALVYTWAREGGAVNATHLHTVGGQMLCSCAGPMLADAREQGKARPHNVHLVMHGGAFINKAIPSIGSWKQRSVLDVSQGQREMNRTGMMPETWQTRQLPVGPTDNTLASGKPDVCMYNSSKPPLTAVCKRSSKELPSKLLPTAILTTQLPQL